jgi:hypothetical protein
MKKTTSILVLVLFTLNSCVNSSKTENDTSNPLTSIADTITFKINSESYILLPYSEHDLTYYVTYSSGEKMIFFFNERGQKTDSFISPSMLGNVIGFTKFDDNLYFLSTANEIVQTDLKGNPVNKYQIDLDSAHYISCFYEFPFVVQDSLAFFYSYPSQTLTSPKNIKSYYESFRETVFNMSSKKITQNNSGGYPKEFLTNTYYAFNPIRTVNNQNQIIYTYPNLADIYIYNYLDKTTSQKTVSSADFKKNKDFDFKRINDYNYISEYLTENSRFGRILFNSFNGKYYRVLAPEQKYSNKKGTVTKWIDKPFIIQVLDKDLNLIKEHFFSGTTFNYTAILPDKDGLLMATYNSVINRSNASKSYVKVKL